MGITSSPSEGRARASEGLGATLRGNGVDDHRRAEAHLRRLVDTIPGQVWSLCPDGTVVYLNQRWHDFTGIAREEAYGGPRDAAARRITAADVVLRIVHPDDAPRALAKWSEILPAGVTGEFEVRLRRHDGEYRWFIVRVEPVHDEQGQVVQWCGTNMEIEDLKRAQNKLREEEHELRGIADAIPQSIVVLGTDGGALYANQSFLAYTGLSLEEALAPASRSRIFHPEDTERLEDARRKALAGEDPFQIEQRIRRRDGQYRWFLIQHNPIRDPEGRVIRWYATGTDIHERKQSEDRVRNENLALREEIDRSSLFEEIVGSSGALRQVLAQVSKVAGTDSTVLVVGETGTGKELIARAIHKRSGRAGQAFIRVNCAAIPPSLIASELFGHEKGAFTGALQRRLGRFEAANGGTIFLDEIGDLPMEAQVALLRVLQERELERIGSTRPIPVDVRVVAATNRELTGAVAASSFRQDLFYRLNVFPIVVPPLRERQEDIPLLVQYLVDRYANRVGKKIRHVSKRTLDLFRAYDWPGNVRELQNVVERAVILCDGETLVVDESWLTRDGDRPPGQGSSLAQAIADREREMIESALTASRGRISGPSGAAAKLGMPRQTLDSKIRALRINAHRFKPAP